jgi:hypothetical protein
MLRLQKLHRNCYLYFVKNEVRIILVCIFCLMIGLWLGLSKSAKTSENARVKPGKTESKSNNQQEKFEDNIAEINRYPQKIIYTKHAKCRMACRHLDKTEVREILEQGKVNLQKSNDRPGTCPTYALEGRTHDGQMSRMVFAFCNDREAKVITVIDLDTDWKCDCE